jgi:protein-arginine kinase activator protein McsA
MTCHGCIATLDEDTGRIGCCECYLVFVRWMKRYLKTGQSIGEG